MNWFQGPGGREVEAGTWKEEAGRRDCAAERHCEHFERHECTANSNSVAVYVSHCLRTRRHKTERVALMSLAVTTLDGGPGWARV